MVDTKTLLERVDVAGLIERDLGQPVRREGRWLSGPARSTTTGRRPVWVWPAIAGSASAAAGQAMPSTGCASAKG